MTQGQYGQATEALLAQLGVLVEGLAAKDPDGPTDCEGWTVADLETHLAMICRSLARLEPVGGTPVGLSDWAAALPALSPQVDEAVKQERLRLADQLPALQGLGAKDPAAVISQLTGRHTLQDAVVMRLVEGVVHGLDVGVEPDKRALKVAVKQLTRAFADRHPGRTVEVRVPPYAAVQCLEGPRHTRGTPPNVVEAEPVAWLRVLTGRDRWADLVATGRITASGERSDLSGLLPLLS
jgi:uncharacterized protein (TIGR03083 family)